jgi:hypothetical protein
MRCHSGEKPVRCKAESKGQKFVWTKNSILYWHKPYEWLQ